jgi:hypothetical protein
VDAWARAALRGELERLGAAPEGTRNHTLNRVAFRLGQLVGAGHLDEADLAARLVAAGVAVGLGPGEVAATVRSGLAAGRASPRGPRRLDPPARALA